MEVGGRVQGVGREPSSPVVLIRPPQVWACYCTRTGGWHQMVLVIRTHDPQGRLPWARVIADTGCLGTWEEVLEQTEFRTGHWASRLPLAILPGPTSQRPSAFVSGATSLWHE